MNVVDFLKSIKFQVTTGSQFMWKCYGDNAWYIDSVNMEHGTSSAVVDKNTGELYEVSYCSEEDYANALCYKWVNPSYLLDYTTEAGSRLCDPWQAFDDVQYIQVSKVEMMLEVLKVKNKNSNNDESRFKHIVRVNEEPRNNLGPTYSALDWLRNNSYQEDKDFVFDMHSGSKGHTSFMFKDEAVATQFKLVMA